MSTDPIDLDAVQARADQHAKLQQNTGRDITLTETVAAFLSAVVDVPGLLSEVRRLRGELERYDRQLTLGAPSTVLGHEGQPAGYVDAIHRQIAQARREVAAAVLRDIPRLCDDCRINVNDRAEQLSAGDVEVPDA